MRETHEPFLEYILSHNPALPVLVMSRPNPEFKTEELQSRERRQIIWETVFKCRKRGYQVDFLDGAELFGEEARECCTVDGIHPMIWDFTGSRRGFLEKYMRFSLDIFGREWYLNFNTTATSCCNMTNAKIRISTDSYRISESRWLV